MQCQDEVAEHKPTSEWTDSENSSRKYDQSNSLVQTGLLRDYLNFNIIFNKVSMYYNAYHSFYGAVGSGCCHESAVSRPSR